MTSIWKIFLTKCLRLKLKQKRQNFISTSIEISTPIELTELESKILENGLLLEEVEPTKRTSFLCVQAMKWAINTRNENNNILIVRLIPEHILVHSFISANYNLFGPMDFCDED
jgi:hypothetical protein